MPNQRDIAIKLGINQATVSLALRGHPSIPPDTRRRIQEAARQLGYHPNSYVSSLMAHVRAGRPLQDKGCIAILVDAESQQGWFTSHTYTKYYHGITTRAEQMGFHTECFFLRAKGMNATRIDGILHARGINGVILAPPRLSSPQPLELHWERYASITTGHSWMEPDIDRVGNDHYKNVLLAYNQLYSRGYRRIGFCLPKNRLDATSSRWLGGYTQCEQEFQGGMKIPVFLGTPEDTPLQAFRAWLKKWKPEAIISLSADERIWLQKLSIRVPEDLAIVCVIHSPGSNCSGVEESNETVGKTTLEMVASQIYGNEFGIPSHPRLVLIGGRWMEGNTILHAAPKTRHSWRTISNPPRSSQKKPATKGKRFQ